MSGCPPVEVLIIHFFPENTKRIQNRFGASCGVFGGLALPEILYNKNNTKYKYYYILVSLGGGGRSGRE